MINSNFYVVIDQLLGIEKRREKAYGIWMHYPSIDCSLLKKQDKDYGSV